jgi:hypothetical protein
MSSEVAELKGLDAVLRVSFSVLPEASDVIRQMTTQHTRTV